MISTYTHKPGKQFYIELDGAGKMPVLHFGMTGTLQVGLPLSYLPKKYTEHAI